MSLISLSEVTSHPFLKPINTSLGSSEKEKIGDIIRNRVIFFIGYPGSGKGTQGKRLADELNIRHLSTGELFRSEVNKGTEIGIQMNVYMQSGQVIPKELTFEYLRNELSKPEYRAGFILDGYPKNLESYEFITKTLRDLQFEPLAALHFDISRESVLERLTGRRHCNRCEHDFHLLFLPPKKENLCDYCEGDLEQRKDDSEQAIKKRLDVFEESTTSVVKEFKNAGLLMRMDAKKSAEEVYKDIISTISELGRRQIQEGGSYYLRNPQGYENSAVFHNHIDAKSHSMLRSIIHKIEEVSLHFQNKIYPVSYLQLGPQYQDKEFESIYCKLPNFHSIDNGSDEAFSTGKMGDKGFNYEQVNATLKVAFQYPDQGVMTELEEDIYQKEFDLKGEGKVVLQRGNTSYTIDWSKLEDWKDKQIPNGPRFELHHSFDVAKKDEELLPPIDVSVLSNETTKQGFQTGGWFIFRNKGKWSYRSNEFSNQSYDTSLSTLHSQALQLRTLVTKLLPNRELTSSCSMEKVHAMWRV